MGAKFAGKGYRSPLGGRRYHSHSLQVTLLSSELRFSSLF